MDQDKVNPFVGNTEAPAGGAPVSNASGSSAPASASSSSAATPTQSGPVNPYAPAGAPYAPGSNTPAPDYATPYAGGTYASPSVSSMSSDGPAVPNTGSSAYTSFSPAPSQNQDIYMPSDSPEKPKLFTKKFIIFAVIGVVLIIAAVVAGVLVQNSKKPQATSPTPSESSDTLESYLGLVLYGDDTKNISEYDPSTVYYATKMTAYRENIDSKFIDSLQAKWKGFVNTTSINSSSPCYAGLQHYSSLLNFYVAHSKIPEISDDELSRLSGKDEEYFKNYYASYRQNGDTMIETFVDNLVLYDWSYANKNESYAKYFALTQEAYNSLSDALAVDAYAIYTCEQNAGSDEV